jgi:hypothetical protein
VKSENEKKECEKGNGHTCPHFNTLKSHGLIPIQEIQVTKTSLKFTTSFSVGPVTFLKSTTWNPWRLKMQNNDYFFLEMCRKKYGTWLIWIYFAPAAAAKKSDKKYSYTIKTHCFNSNLGSASFRSEVIPMNISAATIEEHSYGLNLSDTIVKALMTNDKLYVTISIYRL